MRWHGLPLIALASAGVCAGACAGLREAPGEPRVELERASEREPPFPRIASFRIEGSIDAQAEAMLAQIPLAIVDAEAGELEPAALGRVRARNPGIELLAYLTSEEVPREPNIAEQPLAARRFLRVPASAWLTEPGSTTIEPIDADATRIRVRDPGAFSVTRPRSLFYGPDEPTYLLIGAEHVRLVAIDGDKLVVERGIRSAREAHPAGARIAAHVVFFAGTWMLNLTAPRWRELLVDESAALLAFGPWTGVFLDVCFEDVSFLNGGVLDLDRDGRRDDPAAASAAWRAAFGALVAALRARLGARVPIVANPGAQDCPHRGLDGILLEGWPVGLPPGFLAFDTGLARYLRWTRRPGRRPLTIANAYSPKIGFGTIEPGRDEAARTDYAAMRFGLAVALLGDGYYTYDNGVFGHYVAWWYDEYDGGGLGVGWLGAPSGPPSTIEGAWLRWFENGLSIANPTDAAIRVPLRAPPGREARQLHKLHGAQDPVHNDGSAVTGSIVVPAHDGYLLVD